MRSTRLYLLSSKTDRDERGAMNDTQNGPLSQGVHFTICGGIFLFFAKKYTDNLTPTLSRSFAAVSFQLVPVWSSASTALPSNPSAYLRVGVWGKSWDKTANYFETASPQFRFCPGDKNGLVLRLRIARNEHQNGRFSSLLPV